MNVRHYTYRITWSPEDNEYMATVAEFPSLSWFDPDQTEALHKLVNLVAYVVADMKDAGEPIPTQDGHFPVHG